MSPVQMVVGVVGALLLGVAQAQFLQASPDPSFALQPPPLHQGGFATFSAQPIAPAFVQAPVQPLPVLRQMQQQQQQQQQRPLEHPAVVRNAEAESRLPDELRNNFYKNPRIVEGLAKESWFVPGEEQVLDREAEKIPREQVFKLLKNAGLVRRR